MNARTEFPVETVESPGLRRAALALHATAAADRAWLLAQLPVGHRAALEAMLSELAALGVPPDRQFTQRLLAQMPVPKRVPVPADERAQPAHAWLASVRARDLAALLQGEPAGLAAHVVQLLPVQRRQAVLALLAGPQRRLVIELLQARPSATEAAPRFTQALLAELSARLPQRSRYDTWHRLLQRLRLPGRNGAAA
ncbi:MAG: hypothetical protein V4864_11060 [Pseudomonadota bacterium]